MKEKFKRLFPIRIRFELKNFIEYFKCTNIVINDKNKNKIFYLDSSSYNNLGDQAISYAIGLFVKDNFSDYEFVEILEKDFLRNFRFLKKNIKKDDIIFLTGGGNMGNLYPKYESIRRKTINYFKNNKIIIFPQTIDYDNTNYGQKELKKSIEIYNSNKNLIICAREEKSYNIMKKIYNNVYLIPDIVLYLTKKNYLFSKCDDNDSVMGICFRNDKEKSIDENKVNSIKALFTNIIELSTMYSKKTINQYEREKILFDKLLEFSKCSLVLTDRLHGMIFSVITNTPCIAFDNLNKKVSGVFKTIEDKVNNVRCHSRDVLIEDIDITYKIIKNLKHNEISIEQFDDLVNIIRK